MSSSVFATGAGKPTNTTLAAPGSVSVASLERTQLYSEELGIDLAGAVDAELFKWFLASCGCAGGPPGLPSSAQV